MGNSTGYNPVHEGKTRQVSLGASNSSVWGPISLRGSLGFHTLKNGIPVEEGDSILMSIRDILVQNAFYSNRHAVIPWAC